MHKAKYVFVTGGVTSSLGKGIIAASLAKLLQARGFRVTIQKLDPYINVDSGTLNPYEHGECFVTVDGAETDLDLGHYERFTNVKTSQANNVTTGRIYQNVIAKERKGEYLGKTVQVVPHITNEIKDNIKIFEKTGDYDIIITEIGGTVGDIESLPYIEAVRQLLWEIGDKNGLVIHLTLLPYLSATGELKTKPSQHSVKMLMESGIKADVIVCRSEHPITDDIKVKIALFCNVKKSAVIESLDVSTIYDVPCLMQNQKLDEVVLKRLKLNIEEAPKLKLWNTFLHRLKNPKSEVNIGLIGKYVELKDAYKSIFESFLHAGAENHTKTNLIAIHSGVINAENTNELLKDLNGILIAPGFGKRALEGKILATTYARKNNIPFFGICLGMQVAIIEFSRNVANISNANSREVEETIENPVIDLMAEQKKIISKGGTMRLGEWSCELKPNSLVARIYETNAVRERHRHRYEFNNDYLDLLKKHGMFVTGINTDTNLAEIIEIPTHNWFVGVQFHPEYNSTVINPHPLFASFVKAALNFKNK